MEDRVRTAAWKWETAWADLQAAMKTPEQREQIERQLRDLPNRLED